MAHGGCWWCHGFSGQDLKVLQVGLASFFQDKGPGMGGERNKRRLSPRLALFKFWKTREVVDYLG